jgi:hypothetical protein
MRYITKKVARQIVDAIKGPAEYVFVGEQGAVRTLPHAEFEAQYEPLLRDRTKPAKVAKPRKAKHSAPAEVVPS